MNSLAILAAVLAAFAVAYIFRGRFLEKQFDVDDSNPTPAASRADGCDFVAAKNPFILFGHHFSSIAGAGPVIGPVVASLIFGWAGVLVWIILGSIFLGGTADFSALMVSLRNGGRSISDSSGELISPRARAVFIVFVILALLLVNAIFALYAAKTLADNPSIALTVIVLVPVAILFGWAVYYKNLPTLPATAAALAIFAALAVFSDRFPVALDARTWTVILLIYAFFASVLPVNILLQPRDYLSGFLLFIGMGAGILGIIVKPEAIVYPAFAAGKLSGMWPVLFITVACGAISGFHSMISSGTTSKQLARESHAKPIGYGSMLVEGLLAAIAVITVAGGVAEGIDVKDPIAVFSSGFGRITRTFTGAHGAALAVLLLNFFILTTLDTATRITRYLIEELSGRKNKYVVTAGVIIVSGALAFSGEGEKIWPVFGAANQLVAALALVAVTMWLARRKRKHGFALWPAVFMFVTTMAGLLVKTREFITEKSWHLALVPSALLILAVYVAAEAVKSYIAVTTKLSEKKYDKNRMAPD